MVIKVSSGKFHAENRLVNLNGTRTHGQYRERLPTNEHPSNSCSPRQQFPHPSNWKSENKVVPYSTHTTKLKTLKQYS